MTAVMVAPILLLTLASFASASAPVELPSEVTAERNPGRRSEIAADVASTALAQARAAYESGNDAHGDEELELVGKLANECLEATKESGKQRYWKRNELKIAALARRVRSLANDLSYDQRGKAQELAAQLDAVHDKLLAGVMKK